MQEERLVFDVLLVSDDEDRDRGLQSRLGADPHLRLFVTQPPEATRVLLSLHGVDLIVVSGRMGNAQLRTLEEGSRPHTAVLSCSGHEDRLLGVHADAVVPSGDPALVMVMVRWLLGLPSQVLPARRSVLRRVFGR